jgi:hypothetical protein
VDRFKTFFAEEMNPPRRRFMSMRNFISRWLIRPHVLRFATRRNGPPQECPRVRDRGNPQKCSRSAAWRDLADDHTDSNTHAADARLAAHDLRVLRDALEVVYRMPLREKL